MKTYDDRELVRLLLISVPEIRDEHGAYVQRMRTSRDPRYEPNADAVYGDVLTPMIRRLFGAPLSASEKALAHRVFGLLEELACNESSAVASLLDDPVLELLLDEQETYRRAMDYMGPRTLEAMTFLLEVRGR